MVPPAGFEPALPPPEGGALSPELRGRTDSEPSARRLAARRYGVVREGAGDNARDMAHAELHRDRSIEAADLAALSGRTIAVLGFGNQGAAQAANLRDSGHVPIVGNRDDGYAAAAGEQGFDLRPIADAAAAADVALLLVPDEVQPELVRNDVAPGLREGDTLVVASGYNWHFGLLEVPE